MADIWFWQGIVSPHMAGLACALARQGHSVRYFAEREMSRARARQGWRVPSLDGVQFHSIEASGSVSRWVAHAPEGSVHIAQGLRANGHVGIAQRLLRRRKLHQWVTMETVDDAGPAGYAKRALYRWLLAARHGTLRGILAIGWSTPGWLEQRRVPAAKVYPFAYFLADVEPGPTEPPGRRGAFRILFVGRFAAQKRLGLLIHALDGLVREAAGEFTLQVVGSGPLEAPLRRHAESALGQRVEWVGRLPMDEARHAMAAADCLVLPSRHDGWGAVVSEALMAGTPAIVSDACGSAGVVRASGLGGVFAADDPAGLARLLRRALAKGKPTAAERAGLSAWAKCLGATAGAEYLSQILEHDAGRSARPAAPWLDARRVPARRNAGGAPSLTRSHP